MFNVVLVAPEIPPNTGNVIRLCANSGARLHLVEPLGFSLDDKRLRRAGLDYHEYASVKVHRSFDDLLQSEAVDRQRCFAFTTRASRRYTDVAFAPDDWFVFGAETRGLDDAVRAQFAPSHLLRLPLRPGNRSLNLSNAVAIVVYEAWRQQGFAGGL
ncbi:MAG: tRNA (cytidine(34)-2'-O)-methyltransferase [Sutterellaceae bacterium]|nr:tRNA (cytidine(34)-2'-O)-methyltransferase [Burkholderiaceae bacterium]MCX7901263.1 tRNA (cytidine(34)-2'-O)-methyltransferase [Burkholderiaceae bacterium]MDW8429416.1 tRNA (cytidine(34)-2'-O)-methyltransferase [Sutterellaceae bacterium]